MIFFLIKRFTVYGYDFRWLPEIMSYKMKINCIQTNRAIESMWLGFLTNAAGNTGGIFAITGDPNQNNDTSFGPVAEKILGIPYHGNTIYSVYPGRTDVNLTMQLENIKIPAYQQKLINVTLVSTSEIGPGLWYTQSLQLTFIDKKTGNRKVLLYTPADYYVNLTFWISSRS